MFDTQAWIWWAARRPQLSAAARQCFREADIIGIPAIGIWEFGMLTAKGRVRIRLDADEWIARLLRRHPVELLPPTPEIALLASRLGDGLHRDPADRMIAATALHHGAPLVTADESSVATNPWRPSGSHFGEP